MQWATNLCAQKKVQTSVAILSKVTLSNIGTRLWCSYMNGHGRFHMCVHGVIFQFASLKYGLGYRFQWRHGASWRLKSLPWTHRQPGCFVFKSLSMITPQSFVIMAYYKGNPSAKGDSPHKGPVMWKVFPRHDALWLHTSGTGICETIYTW